MRQFSIGSRQRAYDFTIDDRGWVSAVPRADGTIPVIGGQSDLDRAIEVPDEWSAVEEATGNNVKIAEGESFYVTAQFDESLVNGQVEDALWALRNARDVSGGRLLELGCGPGFLLERLKAALPGWQVAGVDPSPVSVGQARQRGLDVHEGFIDTVDLQGKFDAVVVMGNFQLHNDPAETLRQLASRANVGAELFLDLKNPGTLTRRIARILVAAPGVGRNPKVNSFAAHAWHGLRHGIPKNAVPALLEDNGWRLVALRTVAPRLLRFGNEHSLAKGPKGAVWRLVDGIDGILNERAWTQVAAVRV